MMKPFRVFLCGLVSCVIADPPTDLPQIPDRRPTIMHASVVPSASSVLSRWPDKFIVPVELSNQRAPLFWAAFIDYRPDQTTGGAGFVTSGREEVTSGTTRGTIRTLEITLSPPQSEGCHVVEIVVMLGLDLSTTHSAHTPPEPGGDIVSWQYDPSGHCTALDAGLQPIFDAGADADAEAGIP